MKIIIFVDYSSNKFNKDFELSNALIEKGHICLLVINKDQLLSSEKTYDILLLGNSYPKIHIDTILPIINLEDNMSVDSIEAKISKLKNNN